MVCIDPARTLRSLLIGTDHVQVLHLVLVIEQSSAFPEKNFATKAWIELVEIAGEGSGR